MPKYIVTEHINSFMSKTSSWETFTEAIEAIENTIFNAEKTGKGEVKVTIEINY